MIIKEKLQYKNPLINYLLKTFIVSISILLIYGTFKEDRTIEIVAAAGITLVVFVYLLVFKSVLETEYTETEISYNCFPLTLSKKSIPLKDISTIITQTIDPISEFGGYGLRMKNNKTAYITGNETVRIICKNGKTIFLSISNPTEIRNYITSIRLTV